MTNDTPHTDPKNEAAPDAARPLTEPKFCVEVLMPYGDFPDLKRGDIIENPSEELLAIARTSNCFHIFPRRA